jgi:hypothetical protein
VRQEVFKGIFGEHYNILQLQEKFFSDRLFGYRIIAIGSIDSFDQAYIRRKPDAGAG